MYKEAISLINNAQKIVVIQGENPDGDSLGSSLGLEGILSDLNKEVVLYCAIDIPKYLHYVIGWDRVTNIFPFDADLAIIVDTSSETLLEKALSSTGVRNFLENHKVLVLDHHEDDDSASLNFDFTRVINPNTAATGEMITELCTEANWHISPDTADPLFVAIASDTLGLTTQSANADTFQNATNLVKFGANPAEIDNRRREFMKKPADILQYKAKLIERIEYYLDGKLALIHIPWEEIAKYSDRYNPSVLVLDEMRLVEGVEVACAIKTYPDGKLTGKIRSNTPISNEIAGYFGGGGHSYAAGFKIYESYDKTVSELIEATNKALSK